MNELEAGKKMARLLDQGVEDIDRDILIRLQAVRQMTLESYHATEGAVAAGPDGSLRGGSHWSGGARTLFTTLMLLFTLIGVFYWQTLQQGDENEEIEIMLLADDLPIDAYLDDEFGSWLDHS